MRDVRPFRAAVMIGCLTAVATLVPGAASAEIAGTAQAIGAPVATAEHGASIEDGASIKAATERAWATKPEVRDAVAAAASARSRGQAPQPPAGAIADSGEVGVSSVRDDVVWNARWYWEFGTPYVWSTYWTPCHEYAADCECLNRLAYYWGAGIQLYYTLQGQADAGWYTSYPRPGDLVFWDYDGDGRFGPYDHTGVYTGNGYVIHASAYWGQVAWTTVAVVSQEAYGTYYVDILG